MSREIVSVGGNYFVCVPAHEITEDDGWVRSVRACWFLPVSIRWVAEPLEVLREIQSYAKNQSSYFTQEYALSLDSMMTELDL